MRISSRLEDYLIKALSQSMSVPLMERLAGRVILDYDLHRHTGFPEAISIPQLDAAKQIIKDVKREGLSTRFIEVLIDVDRNGVMGRAISIRSLSQIINEIESLGFLFKEDYGLFVENDHLVKTRGWGVLREGVNYEFSFLSLDIVDNSGLVRQYSEKKISKAYRDLYELVSKIVERREGRIWNWEGDGGLAAFYFGGKNVQAALTGIEILLETLMYNLFDCPFEEPLRLRIAVHTGPCQFPNNFEDFQGDTLRRVHLIESQYTEEDCLTISPGVYSDLGTKLARFFKSFNIGRQKILYSYQLGWE